MLPCVAILVLWAEVLALSLVSTVLEDALPEGTVLHAQVSGLRDGGTAVVDALGLSAAAVLAAQTGRTALSVGEATWMLAFAVPAVFDAEVSTSGVGLATFVRALRLGATAVLVAEPLCLGVGSASFVRASTLGPVPHAQP